jgi:glycosyltransferase involved in cell wall biosynthesis
MASLDILIPTRNRLQSLVMTLAGVAEQEIGDVHVVVSDQSDESLRESAVVKALLRVIEARGGEVEWHEREARGIAEQRDFLLGRASADAVLFLDDDVLMEPWVARRLLEALRVERCGFVGAFPAGLSWDSDVRPSQERIEYWDGPVRPEVVEPGTERWELWQLHRAANLHHVEQRLAPGEHRLYKVTWCAACVLYDREKLLDVGGFSFWTRLPRYHSGEEVLVQNLLLRRWGGCCIIPSGTYFSELPSTVLSPEGIVDAHALDLLPELVRAIRAA